MASEDDDRKRRDQHGEWCEEQASTLGIDAEGEEYEVYHRCRFRADHEGEHACWLCSQKWYGIETPC